MLRECIKTSEPKDVADSIYPKFKQGWKLDPWLHKQDRPWTTETGLVWNLIKFEESDPMPSMLVEDPHHMWLIGNSPVLRLEIPEVKVSAVQTSDRVVDEKLITYDEVHTLALQGYDMPKDKAWAKNRLAVLYESRAQRFHLDVLDKMTTEYLTSYLNARVNKEAEETAVELAVEAAAEDDSALPQETIDKINEELVKDEPESTTEN